MSIRNYIIIEDDNQFKKVNENKFYIEVRKVGATSKYFLYFHSFLNVHVRIIDCFKGLAKAKYYTVNYGCHFSFFLGKGQTLAQRFDLLFCF